MMTKKDYKIIAEVFAECNQWLENSDDDSGATGDFGGYDAMFKLMEDIAAVFKTDNPKFNRIAFTRACGLPLEQDNFTQWVKEERKKNGKR